MAHEDGKPGGFVERRLGQRRMGERRATSAAEEIEMLRAKIAALEEQLANCHAPRPTGEPPEPPPD